MEKELEFEVYQGQSRGTWYWRLKATNGKIIADGGESYKNKADCLAAIQLIKNGASSALIIVQGEKGNG